MVVSLVKHAARFDFLHHFVKEQALCHELGLTEAVDGQGTDDEEGEGEEPEEEEEEPEEGDEVKGEADAKYEESANGGPDNDDYDDDDDNDKGVSGDAETSRVVRCRVWFVVVYNVYTCAWRCW